jgi:uncharacterized Zn finger protein
MISLDKIEARTTSSNLERGKYYYNYGFIRDVKIINDKLVQAKVNGSYIYKVYLEIKGNSYNVFCTCPYDSKGHCKHIVATAILLMDSKKTEEYKIYIPVWQEVFYKLIFKIHKFLFSVRKS